MTTVSETLYGAADYLCMFGHWKGGVCPERVDYMTAPRCLVGAIGAGSGSDEEVASAAHVAVREYLGDVDKFGCLISIVQWNDHPGRTAAEVIEVLRAAAVIEAARESAAKEAAPVGVSA